MKIPVTSGTYFTRELKTWKEENGQIFMVMKCIIIKAILTNRRTIITNSATEDFDWRLMKNPQSIGFINLFDKKKTVIS